MIITKLQGGLANQIFQWAYGKYLSERYSTPLYLDLSFYQGQFGVTKRDFSLNKFSNLSYNILPNDKNISNWSNEPNKTKLVKVSDNFNYSELECEDNSHYYLDGYWQSEKYFTEIEDLIRDNLKPSESTIEKLKDKHPTEDSVSIHIRRTDYLTSNNFLPVLTTQYYQNALNLLEFSSVLVFSDDIEWCKNNLNFNNMIFVEDNDDIQDLWLMSLCNHNIIANSSFSWWGAWLNKNKNKKVIAPKKWFGNQTNLNTSDIIPNSWIKL